MSVPVENVLEVNTKKDEDIPNQCFFVQCDKCSSKFKTNKNLQQHNILSHGSLSHDCSKCKDSNSERDESSLNITEPSNSHLSCTTETDNVPPKDVIQYKRSKLRFKEVFDERKGNLEWRNMKAEE